METLKVRGCSMGCLYGEQSVDKCKCSCKGATHGLLVPHVEYKKCSPSAEKRCKNGEEGKECKCACQGTQHGLYGEIESFDSITINEYQPA